MKTYTSIEFIRQFKTRPVRDDLDRVNCPEAGAVGHHQCGVCTKHNKPRFMCGCLNMEKSKEDNHNPFKEMARSYPVEARRMAQAVVCSENYEQFYACSRFERRMGLDVKDKHCLLSSFLDGHFFNPDYRDIEDVWPFEDLKDCADKFLLISTEQKNV